jgi:hypothetical protein
MRQGHQVGPRGSCCVNEQPLRSPITKRVTIHIEAKVSQVIGAVLTIAYNFFLYGVSVGVGSTQLAYLHAVIVFETFVF